ncbi:Hypothetical predicted protein [Mytilus galloprovincialis]|uniref:Uncharacterized protein n=1 Tax=Mytilus galloprovincialis TaxID=29158 RepID=A0A8B6EGG7_MYTGA|nr:Hypothetical predicted protein [Mytilus galloprovincialis]
MADTTNTRASKPPAKLRDCLTDEKTPVIHTQCDGKTNNVTFKSLRSECWKKAIINHFGPAKACLLKKGSVIKVIFESEKNHNSTVKINFYKTGSIVIQGQNCTQFSDRYFEVIKGKVYQNNNNETSVPNLNNTSIIDNDDETIPKVLNDSHDKVLDSLHDEDDFTVASTPIKQSVVSETKLTPKIRVLQHSKTIEVKFSEINSILSVMDQTMKSFVEKLAQLYSIQEKVPQHVQSVITNSFNTQKNEMLSQWKSIDDEVKHCNGNLDSLHIKSNVLDTQLKQVISKQDEQSTAIESLSSIVTSLQDRVEELENNKRTCNDNENPSVHNDISQVESTPISDINNTSTKLSQVNKTKCDVLILGDSILRRIQPKRFTPQGLPAIVKHLKIALNIPYTNNTQHQRNRRQGDNNFSRSTHQSSYRRDGPNMANHNTNMNSHQSVNPLHGHSFNHQYPPSFNQQHMMPWFLPTNHAMNNPNFNNWRNPWSVPPFDRHCSTTDLVSALVSVVRIIAIGIMSNAMSKKGKGGSLKRDPVPYPVPSTNEFSEKQKIDEYLM